MDSEKITFDMLRKCLDNMKGKRVHVVGDTIVDSYTYCAMIGGQTKTPTMSVLFERQADFIGGAAIVAKHMKSAGAEVTFSTVLGEDAHKDFVIENLREAGVDCRPIIDAHAPDRQQERDRHRRLPAAEGRHARQPLDLRPGAAAADAHRARYARPRRSCSATSATASSTGAPSPS